MKGEASLPRAERLALCPSELVVAGGLLWVRCGPSVRCRVRSGRGDAERWLLTLETCCWLGVFNTTRDFRRAGCRVRGKRTVKGPSPSCSRLSPCVTVSFLSSSQI